MTLHEFSAEHEDLQKSGFDILYECSESCCRRVLTYLDYLAPSQIFNLPVLSSCQRTAELPIASNAASVSSNTRQQFQKWNWGKSERYIPFHTTSEELKKLADSETLPTRSRPSTNFTSRRFGTFNHDTEASLSHLTSNPVLPIVGEQQQRGRMQFQGQPGQPDKLSYTTLAAQTGDSSLQPSSISSSVQTSASAPVDVLTFNTPAGTYHMPVDVPQATRSADQKRARDSGASARFRKRKRKKEKDTEAQTQAVVWANWQELEKAMNFTALDKAPSVGRQKLGSNSALSLPSSSSDHGWNTVDYFSNFEAYQQAHNAAILNPSQTFHLRTLSDAAQSNRTRHNMESFGSFEHMSLPHSPYAPESDNYLDPSGHRNCFHRESHLSSTSSSSTKRASAPRKSTTPPNRKNKNKKRVDHRCSPLLPEQQKQLNEIRKLRRIPIVEETPVEEELAVEETSAAKQLHVSGYVDPLQGLSPPTQQADPVVLIDPVSQTAKPKTKVQDYQTVLMILGQQNKKRLMLAHQSSDKMTKLQFQAQAPPRSDNQSGREFQSPQQQSQNPQTDAPPPVPDLDVLQDFDFDSFLHDDGEASTPPLNPDEEISVFPSLENPYGRVFYHTLSATDDGSWKCVTTSGPTEDVEPTPPVPTNKLTGPNYFSNLEAELPRFINSKQFYRIWKRHGARQALEKKFASQRYHPSHSTEKVEEESWQDKNKGHAAQAHDFGADKNSALSSQAQHDEPFLSSQTRPKLNQEPNIDATSDSTQPEENPKAANCNSLCGDVTNPKPKPNIRSTINSQSLEPASLLPLRSHKVAS